ncbi:ligase-associated DNA damage response DEXH box helicase [Mariniblastus fucicola]|uniref:Putative ATP-dependent helicase Lhr n=1 Tax=Mariniblastus fucicola TaxID=980251 RepID=A0A5B9PCY9_9BACT|nr:ligase-associated DNA damage response DEXH box helicase [Mariniblastus fucicola]QEG23035.1 putative ATP-dependent helicase Lhr [Mariniblastus fucicola]
MNSPRTRNSSRHNGVRMVADWMKANERKPFPFQRKVWKEIVAGRSGLLHSPTGTGKTLAIWMGALAAWLDRTTPAEVEAQNHKLNNRRSRRVNRNLYAPIQVIWVTPLRALAADTLLALREPVEDLKLPWLVERRTSDTASSVKTKQKNRLPSCLITTPESLSILLSFPKTQAQFSSLKLIVLDEWHELMGTKRGVQAELCLSRLRQLSPTACTWAVSATIGNVEQAMQTAIGHPTLPQECSVIKAPTRRKISMKSIVPKSVDRFPWAGHMGLRSLNDVVKAIDSVGSSLVFTNTRSQAERWYAALLYAKPEWAGKIGLHHGSLDRKKRNWVERELDAGNLRCVVCTSSLDLGVDFFPVEQVLQVGSPKGIARLMQRAGRSGHYPGGKSQLVFVPTNALDLIELAAAKDALKNNQIESRTPLKGSLDVLAQHVVTLAAGTAFDESELFREVRSTHAFAELTETQWQWVLDFVKRGGESLRVYPDFKRVVESDQGWKIADEKMARRHRMSIGTISSDREVVVQFMKGGRLGTIEERFISKLKPEDKFMFAGRVLKLVMVRDMTAWVRRAKGKVAAVPRWSGGRLPLSNELAESVRSKLGEANRGQFRGPEMRAVRPLLELQAQWSAVPDEDSLLIEKVKTRDGFHVFVYPFEGRLVHEGLAAILAWRISQMQPITFATTINDYGIELLSPTDPPLEKALESGLFSPLNLLNQIEKSMNATELDRRQFRDIARIAGLVFGGVPGHHKSSRQLQASSDMFFDVFREYDPENLLLRQARREVLDMQLEHVRLAQAMERLSAAKIVYREPPKPTPLSFPILVDRLRLRLSSEKLSDRVARMTQQYERAAEKKLK